MKILPSWLSFEIQPTKSHRPEGGFLLTVTCKDIGKKKVATILAEAADRLSEMKMNCEFQDGVGIVVRIPSWASVESATVILNAVL